MLLIQKHRSWCFSRFIFWFAVGILLNSHLLAQASRRPYIKFSQIAKNEGLSQSNITAILQDDIGFIWVGTEDGLNRLDGYNIEQYNHDQGLWYSYVQCLMQSENGHIWIGTRGGVIYDFDPYDKTFREFEFGSQEDVSIDVKSLVQDTFGNIWMASPQIGLGVLYKGSNKFQLVDLPSIYSDKNVSKVYTLALGVNNEVYIAATNAIYQIKVNDNLQNIKPVFDVIGTYVDEGGQLSSGTPWDIFVSDDGTLWIACWEGGIDHYSQATNQWSHYTHDPNNSNGLASNKVTSVIQADNGIVWIGMLDEGLNRLDPKINHFTHFSHEPGQLNRIGSNYVKTIFNDKNEGVWVGTFGSGINYYSPYKNKFIHIQQEDQNSNSLSNNDVFAIIASRRGEENSIWIGTHGGGLNLMLEENNIGQRKINHFRNAIIDQYSISNDVVLSICERNNGDLFIGTYDGLNLMTKKEKNETVETFYNKRSHKPKFRKYYSSSDPSSLSNHSIWALLEDNRQRLWIGTNYGLNKYQDNSLSFSRYLHDPNDDHSISNNTIRTIYQDSKDRIWLGTHGGINFIDESNDVHMIGFKSGYSGHDEKTDINTLRVLGITEDRNGRIWYGTEGYGIGYFIPDGIHDDSKKHFGLLDGLAGNVVENILTDLNGDIWVSTNNGISHFNPDTLIAYTTMSHSVIKNYTASDGLQSNEFSSGACDVNRDGYIYLGGTNGLNIFHPDQLLVDQKPPNIVATSLKILGSEIKKGGKGLAGDIILKGDIAFSKNIRLSYKDYAFTIGFSGLSYALPLKNKYQYQLEGLDKNWIDIGHDNTATFTNLDGGHYVFKVKGCNQDGVWSDPKDLIEIYITPPFWKSKLAYLLYILALVASFFGYANYKTRKEKQAIEAKAEIENAKIEERERMRRNTSADFHDELGNKITKITLYAEMARREANEKNKLELYLKRIEDNVQTLSHGIRDFIWVLDPEKDTMYDTLVRIKDFGDELFQDTDIKFRTEGLTSDLERQELSLVKRRNIVLIFKEAMNNALKYARCNSVHLNIVKEERVLHLCLRDDGVGFDMSEESNGYGLTNIQKRSDKIGAQLSIQSSVNKGTTIKLCLPMVLKK